jgi:hypothetical protein
MGMQRPQTKPDDAVRWWVGEDGDHTSMLFHLYELEEYIDRLEAAIIILRVILP